MTTNTTTKILKILDQIKDPEIPVTQHCRDRDITGCGSS